MKYIITLLALCLSITGCSSSTKKEVNAIPILYSIRLMNVPNEPPCDHEYGETQTTGVKVRQYLKSKSAEQSMTNTTHISVWLVPFVHSQTWARPYDLRIQEAKLDAFINWIDKDETTIRSEDRNQIPVKAIESDLYQMCLEVGIANPTVMRRGSNLELYLTHNHH